MCATRSFHPLAHFLGRGRVLLQGLAQRFFGIAELFFRGGHMILLELHHDLPHVIDVLLECGLILGAGHAVLDVLQRLQGRRIGNIGSLIADQLIQRGGDGGCFPAVQRQRLAQFSQLRVYRVAKIGLGQHDFDFLAVPLLPERVFHVNRDLDLGSGERVGDEVGKLAFNRLFNRVWGLVLIGRLLGISGRRGKKACRQKTGACQRRKFFKNSLHFQSCSSPYYKKSF